MKRIIVSIILFLILVLPAAAMDAFVIDSYHIDMDVTEDNSYRITEIIEVDFTEERRGIVRELPLYFDKNPVRIHSVAVGGHEATVVRDKRTLSIRIGNPEVYLYGKVRYVISYVYDVGADRLGDMDEFNHNLIGLEWDTVISEASFDIRLPKAFNPDDVNITSGPYGSTDNTGADWKVEGNGIRGSINRPLGPHEGLTVALPLPEGYWSGAKRHLPPLKEIILGYPVYVLMIISAFIFWYRKGRDNKIIPVIEFEPPDGLTPAEIGYIVDGKADSEDITSLIIYWAQKGCLRIEETSAEDGGGLVLYKVKELPEESRGYEKSMFGKLFSFGTDGRVTMDDLNYKFHTTITETQNEIVRYFAGNPERAVYQASSESVKTGTLQLSSGCVSGIFAFVPVYLISLEMLKAFAFSLPLRLFLGFFIVIFIIAPFSTLGYYLSLSRGVAKKKEMVIASVFGTVFSAALGFVSVRFAYIPVLQYLAALGSSMICSFFVHNMSRRTEYGDRILSRVLGFREFIDQAERDRLETMFESNPQYYYDILPYALVMRLSSKWSSHFDAMTLQPPSWYAGYRTDRFNSRDFERDLHRNMADISRTMSSAPPSSSGSSGSSGSSSSGGFSGGGSGGGGGHSW